MNIVTITRTFVVALVLVLVLTATGLWAAGAEEEPAAATEKETVFDPATGMTWTAPQYGGTLTSAVTVFPPSTDNWWNLGWAPHLIGGVVERLAFADWGLSRDIWNGRIYSVVTPEMTTGALAESWSMPDDTTFIWNIRQGVRWHDKAPMNGREFDAYDVEWNYHRYFGLGDFTEDGPNAAVGAVAGGVGIESVTATDQWTVEIKLTKPHLDVLGKFLNGYFFVHAPEQIEEYGDAKDWRNLVGTGPWRLTDFVEGSSATWEKNPDYWGYDEKFPENRLPYIDELRSLLIPDMSARLAALRTGKIDMMGNVGDSYINSIDDLESLQKTNPEIDVWPVYNPASGVLYMNLALPAITADVNVRKALQMAVDRETIAATYFRGFGDPAPYGYVHQSSTGWSWPYEEWPDEVKQEYTYHPERAEELLDAAGYPRGDDGYRFKVEIAQFNRYEPTYPELVMGYLDAIGVDSELFIQTSAESGALLNADTHEYEFVASYYGWFGSSGTNLTWISQNFDGRSHNKAKDPRIDALHLAAIDSTDLEEFKSIIRQADEITVREHLALVKSSSPWFSVSQPWVQGYFGEAGMGNGERNTHLARLWIDSELKQTMMEN